MSQPQLTSGRVLNVNFMKISIVTTTIPSVTFTVVIVLALQGSRNRPTTMTLMSRARPATVEGTLTVRTSLILWVAIVRCWCVWLTMACGLTDRPSSRCSAN